MKVVVVTVMLVVLCSSGGANGGANGSGSGSGSGNNRGNDSVSGSGSDSRAPRAREAHPRKFGNHVTVQRPTARRPSAPQDNQCLFSHF